MEIQIKATMRFHFILTTMAKSKRMKTTVGEDMERLELLDTVSRIVKSTTF